MFEIKKLKRTVLFVFIMLMLLAAGCAAVTIGAVTAERDVVSLDLQDAGFESAESLKDLTKLKDLRSLDLRGNPLTVGQIGEISAMLPDCDVRWSVPIGSERFDSASASLTLAELPEAEISNLSYFPNLVSVDATGCEQYAALIQAAGQYPDVSFAWTLAIGGATYSNDETVIHFTDDVSVADLETLLSALPKLETVNLLDTNLLIGDVTSLKERYPNVRFRVNAVLQGERYETGTTSLSLSHLETFSLETLTQELAQFPSMKYVDLRTLPLTESDISFLSGQYPNTHFRWTIPLLDDFSADSDAVELDLRGYTVTDLNEFQRKLSLFSQLTYIDMCNCGPSDEEMEAMRNAMPEIEFVWLLHIGYWEVRTDIKAFTLAQKDEHAGVKFTKKGDERRRYRWVGNDEIAKIRYCREIEALDIGHTGYITDISFVKDVPTLRFLVIARTPITDISAVAYLKNLTFFETFGCDITDVSVLYDLPQLEYYNCSANRIEDISPLLSLTNLKRLWVIKCRFTDEQLHELKVGLPDTIIMAYGTHQTDNGWRYDNPAYLEMQALFGLQPQLSFVEPGWLLPENQIP
jgi:Leucine-rich repeat (LRR) protein